MANRPAGLQAFITKLTENDLLPTKDRRAVVAEARSDNNDRRYEAIVAAEAAYYQCMMFRAERRLSSVDRDKKTAEFAERMHEKAFAGLMLRMEEWSLIPCYAKYEAQRFISAVKVYEPLSCYSRDSSAKWQASKEVWLDRIRVRA